MIAAIKRRWFPADPVLPGYREPKHRQWSQMRDRLFITALVFVGLFYGLLSAIFPVFLYLYLALPLIILAGLVVWALPDSGRLPARTIEALFWAFLCAQLIWPNYIAIALPGLPWITINRLVTAPLALLFLIALSQSRELRAQIGAILANSRFMTRCFIAFMVLQVLTLALSSTLATSLNKFIDAQIQWNLIFFIAAFVFSKEGRALKFFKLYTWLTLVLIAVAVFEWRASAVLWANSIPSFLKVADESVETILGGSARSATGLYRVQSIFSTSLNFAEVLGLATPFFIYWIIYARRVVVRIAAVLFLPILYWMILRTDSRLGVVGFFGSFIVFSGLYGVRRWRSARNDILGPAIVLFYPFAIALFYVGTLVSNRLGAVIWGNGPQAASTEGRKQQYLMAFPKIGVWPFGNGIGTGAETLGAYNLAGVLTIDSYYLVVALEYGVLGFVAWLGIMIGAAVQAGKWGMRAVGDEANMMPIMSTFMIMFVVLKGVLAQDDSHGLVYMMLGMIAGVGWRLAQREKGIAIS